MPTPDRVLIILAAVLLAASACAAGETPGMPVRKTAESFDEAAWPPEPWARAPGATRLSADVAPEAGGGKCLDVEAKFTGSGFEWFAAMPAEPLVIPGQARSVTMRFRYDDKRYPIILNFRDGWGRTMVGPKKLEFVPPSDTAGKWGIATFRVPDDWVRPVSIVSVATHNWSAQGDARTVRFWVDNLEVETDLGDVDPETGALKTWKPDPQPAEPAKALKQQPRAPLVAVEISSGQVGNVFSLQPPAVAVRVRNWKAGTLTGTVALRLADFGGREVDRQEQPVSVESTARLALPLKAERYGLYTLETSLALSDGTKRQDKMTLARVPPERNLSESEKRASPYGINVHGAGTNFVIEPFRKAGIVWFREYAFSYEWLLRAKGDDKKYAGWPWYPAIARKYAEAGVKVMPCLQKAVQPPEMKDGKPAGRIGPDRAWIREISDILLAFPQFTHWELDNEYDLSQAHVDAEQAVEWRNYRAYHRKFAEIAEILGGGELVAVEQGRAGTWPTRERECVASGDFDKIAVLNSHYYCGTEPPETSLGNWNMDVEGGSHAQPPMLLADRLREVKRAATSDGRPRESWLTEFGWDTLAGPIVSPRRQAAYLARAWMLAMAAGTDKCFWFYDHDAAEPKQFFDGCGLLGHDSSPKLALAAMAGLTSVLPTPKYVGSLSAGDGTAGYVFESGGDLVAALWTIDAEQGPQVAFKAKELRDSFGNKLDGLSARLSPMPVYAVGLDRSDPLYRQTAYGLATPGAVIAAAGDALTPTIEVYDNREAPIECSIKTVVPEGWTASRAPTTATVAKGERKALPLPITVGGGEGTGMREVKFEISEGGPVREMALKVLVRPAVTLQVGPLGSKPGPAVVDVKIGNRSARPLDGVLRLRLPASWKAQAAEVKVEGLRPGETRALKCDLTWTDAWKPGESAMAEFNAGGGLSVARPVIPGLWRLARAKDLKIDGQLDDWPAEAKVPAWMLGSTLGQADAEVYLAWSPEGLYGAVEVASASLDRPDPRSFWVGNCLELFIDSRDEKRDRRYEPGDHQFWLVPLVAEKRVYAGQWKRGSETAETRYDLATVRGVALPKAGGYVMEFLLPAAEIQKFKPAPGGDVGLNLNLTIKDKQFMREVYWPASKGTNIQDRPAAWGSVELTP